MISIGNGCYVRHIIENYYYKQKIETNFFDWLLTSMKSVNQLFINLKDCRFTIGDFSIDEGNPPVAGKYRLIFNKFPYMVSIHDARTDIPYDESLQIVADRYTRRAARLYSTINAANRIVFVRYSAPSAQEIDAFFSALKNINGSNHYKLLIFDTTDTKYNEIGPYGASIKKVDIEKYRIPGVAHQTWLPEYDWASIMNELQREPFMTEW